VLGGSLAQVLGHGSTGVAWTMAALATLSLLVTVSLTRGLRRTRPSRDEAWVEAGYQSSS
jgi:hypothetical protein